MSSRGKEWEDGGGTSGWPGGGDGTGAPTPTSGAAPRIDEPAVREAAAGLWLREGGERCAQLNAETLQETIEWC